MFHFDTRLERVNKESIVMKYLCPTHFTPIFQFYTPWKCQKTSGLRTNVNYCFSKSYKLCWVKIFFKYLRPSNICTNWYCTFNIQVSIEMLKTICLKSVSAVSNAFLEKYKITVRNIGFESWELLYSSHT